MLILLISFTLSHDVALHVFLDLPILISVGSVISLWKGDCICSNINKHLLQLDHPNVELPHGTKLNSSSSIVPFSNYSNNSSSTSLLMEQVILSLTKIISRQCIKIFELPNKTTLMKYMIIY